MTDDDDRKLTGKQTNNRWIDNRISFDYVAAHGLFQGLCIVNLVYNLYN